MKYLENIGLKPGESKRLFQNFLSLNFLQAANYVLPFITVPYLVRVLGTERYGIWVLAQAVTQYFILLVDYGFNQSGTREISTIKQDAQKISEAFCGIFLTQIALLLVGLSLLLAFLALSQKMGSQWRIYLLAYGLVFGHVLFPVWFFQGMEKMSLITVLNVGSKFFFTISIFVFVREENDLLKVPILNSLGFILAGILALVVIKNHYRIKFQFPGFARIFRNLKEGFFIFINTLILNAHQAGPAIILGFLTNDTMVGNYAIGEKITRAVGNIFQPIGQAIYPLFAKKISEGSQSVFRLFKRLFLLTGMFSIAICISLFFWAGPIVKLVAGKASPIAENSLQILLLMVIPVALNRIVFPLDLALKEEKSMTKYYFAASIVFLVACISLTSKYSYLGTSVSVVLVETLVFLAGILVLKSGRKRYLKSLETGKVF